MDIENDTKRRQAVVGCRNPAAICLGIISERYHQIGACRIDGGKDISKGGVMCAGKDNACGCGIFVDDSETVIALFAGNIVKDQRYLNISDKERFDVVYFFR